MTKIAKMNKNVRVRVEWHISNLVVDICDYSDYITDCFGKIFISDSNSLREEEVGSFRFTTGSRRFSAE